MHAEEETEWQRHMKRMENIYESGAYLEKNPLWHADESPWKAQQILRMLKRNQLTPRTICEVGCGAGEVLRQLQESLDEGCMFVGYEISPQAFELCRSRANERLRFKLCNIRDENVCFDAILVLDVIEHLEDCFSFLRDLRPKGRYKIFHIPLDLSVQTVLRPGGLLKRRDLYAHLQYFTKETALRTLSETGYKVLECFYTTPSVDLGATLFEMILRWPRKVCFAIHQDFTARILGGFSLMVLAK